MCGPPMCAMGLGPLWSGSRSLPKMDGRGVLQDLIPYVGQLVLPQIPIVGRVIDSYEHGFLDSPGNTMCLPTHNGETVYTDAVLVRMIMLVNGGGSPKVLLKSVLKGPPQFPMYSSLQSSWLHLNQ